MSVCSSQHGLKQIKHCFNARAGCKPALRSDGRLCLQSYYLSAAQTVGNASMYLCCTVAQFMTMELRAVVMFYSALLGATLPACALKQGLICFNLCQAEQTLTIGTLSRHRLKQIKLCFNSRAGYEAALRSDGRLCLQSHYIHSHIYIVYRYILLHVIHGRSIYPTGLANTHNIVVKFEGTFSCIDKTEAHTVYDPLYIDVIWLGKNNDYNEINHCELPLAELTDKVFMHTIYVIVKSIF